LREPVDRPRLEALLKALGESFRHPARLYLSGGEGMIWRGLRGTTQDVDIAYDVAPGHHDEWIRALRDLKERLSVSIEEAQPADFIPVPPGAEARLTFVGRYGSVDVFLADPYSVALSKVERGLASDFDDVRRLLAAHVIVETELRRLFEAILPVHATSRVNADPARFRANLEDVLRP
jgi:hypothetical protein